MFTFVLDFQGGTYIRQSEGALETAFETWLSNLEFAELSGHDLGILRDSLIEDKPTPIVGLTNVWCSTGLVGEKLAIVHIIETTTDSANVSRTV